MNNENDKKTEEQSAQIQEKNVTVLTPTQLDEEKLTKVEKERDISSIIPEYDHEKDKSGVSLQSRETELKSDGVAVIGRLKDEYELEMYDKAIIPDQIDIKQRREEAKKLRNQKRKVKEKASISEIKKAQKKLTKNSLVGVVMILIVVLSGLYIYYKPKDSDFKVLTVYVELGDKLPTRKNNYVKPATGELTDEMSYSIDTSSVIIDEIGEYPFKVSHNGVVKQGTIVVRDTTPPTLELRDVVLNEGDKYTANSFVSNCVDLTGCTVKFKEEDTLTKYTAPGNYTIYISAVDAFDNEATVKASLSIEAIGMVKFYEKENQFNYEEGYSSIIKYELHFTDFMQNAIILNGTKTTTYIYSDTEHYEKGKDKYYGVEGYTCDDANNRIILTEQANTVGNGYSKMEDVANYLINEQFREVSS